MWAREMMAQLPRWPSPTVGILGCRSKRAEGVSLTLKANRFEIQEGLMFILITPAEDPPHDEGLSSLFSPPFTSKNTLAETSRMMVNQISGSCLAQSHKLHHHRGTRALNTGKNAMAGALLLKFKLKLFYVLIMWPTCSSLPAYPVSVVLPL